MRAVTGNKKAVSFETAFLLPVILVDRLSLIARLRP